MYQLSKIIIFAIFLFLSFSSSAANKEVVSEIESKLRNFQNFPKQGVTFLDISGLLASPQEFSSVIDIIANRYKNKKIDAILALESRGFIFAAPVAHKLSIPVIMIRKPNKLPGDLVEVKYKTEYSTDTIQMQLGNLQPGANVIIIDDLLATGGTAAAAITLAKKAGYNVLEFTTVIELSEFKARSNLKADVFSVLTK